MEKLSDSISILIFECIDQLEARIVSLQSKVEELEEQRLQERVDSHDHRINFLCSKLDTLVSSKKEQPSPKEDSLEEVICESFENSPYKDLEKTSEIVAKAVRQWNKDRLPKKKTTATIAGITASDCIFNHCLDTVNQNLGLNEGSENE